MEIYIMNGQGGSGKTTFQDYVAEIVDEEDAVVSVSMVSYVKAIAKTFGWQGTKEPKDRKMLSQLKDLLTEWDDSPFRTTCMMVDQARRNGAKIVFIDAREKADIERLKEKFNCQAVLMVKGEKVNYGNHADDEVFDINYDITIYNDGTLEDLRFAAERFVTYVVKGEKE